MYSHDLSVWSHTALTAAPCHCVQHRRAPPPLVHAARHALAAPRRARADDSSRAPPTHAQSDQNQNQAVAVVLCFVEKDSETTYA